MIFNKTPQLSDLEISNFFEQLKMITAAGISAQEGLAVLTEDTTDEKTKCFLEKMYKDMESGYSLDEAMDSTGAFPDYARNMVSFGFQTGNLDNTFSSLAGYYQREHDIKTSVRNAITYPVIMVIMMIAVILVLVTKVLPIFQQIYSELGSQLTGFPGAMLKFSTFMNNYLLYILLAIIAIVLIAIFYFKSGSGRQKLKKSKIAIAAARSRFANCIAVGLHSGMLLDESMDLAAGLVENPLLQEKILACKEQLAEGEPFAKVLQTHGVIENTHSSLISIGFKTGSVDKVMAQISEVYENEADDRISRFISVLEPALVIVMSCVIGFIMLSFLLPLIGIMTSIG